MLQIITNLIIKLETLLTFPTLQPKRIRVKNKRFW